MKAVQHTHYKFLVMVALLAVLLSGGAFTAAAQDDDTNTDTVTDTVDANPVDSSLPPIPVAARGDNRVTIWHSLVGVASLNEMYHNSGPFTVLAFTDAAFGAIPAEIQNRLYTDSNFARQVLLHHTFKGNLRPSDFSGSQETGLGTWVSARTVNNIPVFAGDVEGFNKFGANNGTVYIVDGVLAQNGGVYGGTSPGSAGDVNAPMTGNNAVITHPSQNRAWVAGGPQSYRNAIQRESGTCKQMTWTVTEQGSGSVTLKTDHYTNPYRGDTSCYRELPIACVAGIGVGATVKATSYVKGIEMTSLSAANRICQQYFGEGYRMLDFHFQGGWSATLSGNLPIHTRFWIYIGNQNGNGWDSIQPGVPQSGTQSGPTRTEPATNPDRIEPWEGIGAGRPYCKVMTFVVMRQYNGLVQIGADSRTNPYTGDMPCTEPLHMLCVRVGGYGPPPTNTTYDDDYSIGWSGGQLAVVGPFPHTSVTSVGIATDKCRAQLGSSWRSAEFHDGAFGQSGTAGWQVWGYDGGVYAGDERIVVHIGDQVANSYDQ